MFLKPQSQNAFPIKDSYLNKGLFSVGRIKEAFGINGLAKIEIFCEDQTIFIKTKNFYVGNNRFLTDISLTKNIHENIWLGRFSLIQSREEIIKRRGQIILCKQEVLPKLASNEYYYIDLIGLNIEINHDDRKGLVKNVVDFGSGDLLEIQLDNIEKTFFVPFNEENVLNIDLNMKKIFIKPQKGLLPEN